MAVHGLMDALHGVHFLLRGVSLIGQTSQVGKKLYEYDAAQWETKDYLEVAATTGCIVADGFSMHSDWNIRGLTKDAIGLETQVSDLTKAVSEAKFEDIEKTKEILKTTQLALDNSKTMLQHTRNISAIACNVGAATYIAGETASGRPIQDVLCSAPALMRIAGGIESAGSAWTSNHPQLSSAAQITGVGIATGALARGAFLAGRELIVLANRAYQNYRGGVIANNLRPGESPLTVPPRDHNYNAIPEGYDEDPIFSRYEYPITNNIIRYPVAIRENGVIHYYELAAIYMWIRDHGTNPLTRGRLNLRDVNVDLEAQRAIENRMKELNLPLP